MNTKSLELISKIDIKKTAMYVGGALLLIALFLVVRKMIKKYQAEKKDEEYQKTIASSVNTSDLTYNEADYMTMAETLLSYLSDTRAGWAGVDEDGIFDVMGRMKTDSDIYKLINAFGKQEIRKRWQTKTEEYTLPGAIAYFLDQGERDEVNEILAENGLTYRF